MVPSMHPRIRDFLSVSLREVGIMGSVSGYILGLFWGQFLVPKCVPKLVPKRDPKVGAEWEDVVCPTGPAGGGGGCGVSSRRQLEEYSEPTPSLDLGRRSSLNQHHFSHYILPPPLPLGREDLLAAQIISR